MSEETGGLESAGTDGPNTTVSATTMPPPPTGEPLAGPRQAAAIPRPAPRVIRPPSPLKPAWIASAAAVGVLADAALRIVPWDQLGTSLLILAVALGLAASGFVRTRSSRMMLGLAVVFAVFLTWRTGFLLSTFNLLAAAGLVTGAAAFGRRGDIWNAGPTRLVSGAVAVLEGMLFVPVGGIEETEARYHAWSEGGNDTARAVIRGVVIAGPVVLILGLLLASADVVFESFFTGFDLHVDDLFGHLVLLGLGVAMMVTLLRVASRPESVEVGRPGWRLGAVESSVILGSITVLFAAFAYAQILTVVGGADEALSRAGLGPADFARQGFFQLLWVAGITLFVLMTIRVLADGSDTGRRVARLLGLATVALTMVIVAVALTRISFYVDDSGLTARRLYAAVISIWIAIGFVLVAVRLVGFRRDVSWLTPALVLSAVGVLVCLNLANPQRRIAENNLDRNEAAIISHVQYGQFRGDGRATLADNLDRLSPELAAQVERELCLMYGDDDPQGSGLFGFNAGRAGAAAAIDRLCG